MCSESAGVTMDHVSIRNEPALLYEVNDVFSIRAKRLLNLNLGRGGNITCVCLHKVLMEQ